MRRVVRLLALRALGLLLLMALALGAWLIARTVHADEPPPPRPPPRLDVSPEATGQTYRAPAGTTLGRTTPQTNATGMIINPPRSPTPPNFPFGAPGGSWAPAGPPFLMR